MITAIAATLSVSEQSVRKWTNEQRKAADAKRKDEAKRLWLACHSQDEIAERTGLDQSTISRLEKKFMQTDALVDLHKFFKAIPDHRADLEYFRPRPPNAAGNPCHPTTAPVRVNGNLCQRPPSPTPPVTNPKSIVIKMTILRVPSTAQPNAASNLCDSEKFFSIAQDCAFDHAKN